MGERSRPRRTHHAPGCFPRWRYAGSGGRGASGTGNCWNYNSRRNILPINGPSQAFVTEQAQSYTVKLPGFSAFLCPRSAGSDTSNGFNIFSYTLPHPISRISSNPSSLDWPSSPFSPFPSSFYTLDSRYARSTQTHNPKQTAHDPYNTHQTPHPLDARSPVVR